MLELVREKKKRANLSEAKVIVAGGRGVGDAGGFKILESAGRGSGRRGGRNPGGRGRRVASRGAPGGPDRTIGPA